MKKITSITSDLICAENIFAQVKCPQDLAIQLVGVLDILLSAVKEAVPNLEIRVKDGPKEMASVFLEITMTEEKK